VKKVAFEETPFKKNVVAINNNNKAGLSALF
jgi:hypothetical protein